jgi:hypothetical protein
MSETLRVLSPADAAAVLAEVGVRVPELETLASNGHGPSSGESPITMTAREICALPDVAAIDEVLGSLAMRRQRLIVGAHTGHGKTTFVLQMVQAVVTGGEFVEFRGSGGRALIVDGEQGLRTIKRRLREAGLEDCETIDVLRAPDGLSLDQDRAEREELERILARGYDIVIADPLYKLHRGDSNDERSAVDLMRVFDGWRERFGFALVMVVHLRKPPAGARFTMHEFFGSSAYLRGAEVVVGLQTLRPGYSRLHFFKDRDGDLPVGESWGLLFDRETGFRRDPDDGKPRETAADKIRALLETEPELSLAELAKAAGCAEKTALRALKDLGAVARSGLHGAKQWSLEEAEP